MQKSQGRVRSVLPNRKGALQDIVSGYGNRVGLHLPFQTIRMYKSQLKSCWLIFLLSLAVPYLCSGQPDVKKSINISMLVDSLNASLGNNYVFPEKANKIAVYLQAQIKKGAYTVYLDNPQKLAEKIQADIRQVHHDPHLEISYDPNFTAHADAQPSEEEMEQSRSFWKEQNYSFRKVDILPGNIGYLPFDGFVDDIESAKPTIYSALRFLANTSAIIIDLRENRGGSPAMVSQIESYFFREKTHMNDIISRGAKDTTVFYADPAKADSLNLSMPVYILTSHQTFSAAEDFSYGMQMARRAVIVGEVTGGGAHPQMPFSIGQGFVASIPFARSYNPITKTDWEGTGVTPDVKVNAGGALLKAQEVFFKTRLLAAKDEREKHQAEYYLRALIPTKEVKNIPLSLLKQFTGAYPDVTIYLEKNRLYCRNNHNRKVTELKHISKDVFVLEENAQIEFVKGSSGRYSSAKIYLSNGMVIEEGKK
jgi:C-terminal processing protease CtpA/Prc